MEGWRGVCVGGVGGGGSGGGGGGASTPIPPGVHRQRRRPMGPYQRLRRKGGGW